MSTHRSVPKGYRAEPPVWLWLIRVPVGVRSRIWHHADHLGRFIEKPWPSVVLCTLLGAFPAYAFYFMSVSGQHLLTAVLLTPFLVGSVARDSFRACLVAVGVTFFAHSIVSMLLAAHDPEGLGAVLPAGAAYWEESRNWIATGTSPEYDLNWWLPAHFQLLGAVTLFTYTSLGFVTLWQGLYEVDLMNFYVGQLVTHSRSPWVALAVGWHPWSLCRGLGYLLITFEVASYSLERLTGVCLSSLSRRRRRWLAGISLLLLDGIFKFAFLQTVCQLLAENIV